MNKYYNYENIFLWDDSTWAARNGNLEPLLYHLYHLNYKLRKESCSIDYYKDHPDESLTVKTNSFTFSDVTAEWEKKGLHYHCTGMGGINWIAMVPLECVNGKLHNPTVLVVPNCTDTDNPRWAMNTLKHYQEYLTYASQNKVLVLFLNQGADDCKGVYVDIMLEVCSIYRVNFSKAFIDLTALHCADENIKDVPGINAAAFSKETILGSIPAVSITDQWESTLGHQVHVRRSNRRKEYFDAEVLKHSTVGHRMADSIRVEYDYDQLSKDPLQKNRWTEMGLVCDEHFTEGERWLTMVPKEALGVPEKKIPLILVMKEVRDASDFMTLTAFQFYYDLIEIAANGECMLLFFALETADDNELLVSLLKEAEKMYPVDPARVYITGQSHNGYLALEFARRHFNLIAAVATLNDRIGMAAPSCSVDIIIQTDEMIEEYARHDLPLINILGQAENILYTENQDTKNYLAYADGFRRRMKAFRCTEYSTDEIAEARRSSELACRMNGIPSDRSEVRYIMGNEAYICDYKNRDNKWHLRLVSLQNLPHMISPAMFELSWSFLRRFARDSATGRIIELY